VAEVVGHDSYQSPRPSQVSGHYHCCRCCRQGREAAAAAVVLLLLLLLLLLLELQNKYWRFLLLQR